MDVMWLRSVHNDATDGCPTFVHGSSLGILRQRWFSPEIVGNPDSGEGIICKGDGRSGDAKANSSSQLALINLTINDHGGYGLRWRLPSAVT